jgi:heme exporter protein D|tara:strand:+ start:747 stop:932 length:186 start_codon:yes stop_codon:yes gene_type:complete
MDGMGQFLAMGGYAGYVWPAFAIVLVVMAALWIVSDRSWRKSEQTLAALRKYRRQRESDGS